MRCSSGDWFVEAKKVWGKDVFAEIGVSTSLDRTKLGLPDRIYPSNNF
ncbi:hypothetical protein VCRA2126O85_360027 [Vibrio crassostreae]|nr:hypothetical protein VCRA2126O86_150091 [Vibrio crassostreae]CAK2888180.1 hypothetical protein VCRA2128O106_350025 [Vibrio crassostreae]CAK2890317.1 hypothetical protein VCRA2128O100_370027 [Vibrio crassostreae]CAK2891986.1 hypothetical protein VCRA2125O83_350032 [Vibrio crassostreae]CAK2895802.1 hypothetical protein VCRA2126O85_360027 [Vibrio crassostreae]